MLEIAGMIIIAARWILSVFFVVAGIFHFVFSAAYVAIVPAWLPAALALVYISGLAEIAGGIGVIIPRLRRIAGWGLIALLIAVFPANINMAMHHIALNGRSVPEWALWARLPLQTVFIACVYWTCIRRASTAQG